MIEQGKKEKPTQIHFASSWRLRNLAEMVQIKVIALNYLYSIDLQNTLAALVSKESQSAVAQSLGSTVRGMNTVMMTLGILIPCGASQLDCQLCQDLAFALRVATKMGVKKSIEEIMSYRCFMYEKGDVEDRCHEVASTLEHVGKDARKRLVNKENTGQPLWEFLWLHQLLRKLAKALVFGQCKWAKLISKKY